MVVLGLQNYPFDIRKARGHKTINIATVRDQNTKLYIGEK